MSRYKEFKMFDRLRHLGYDLEEALAQMDTLVRNDYAVDEQVKELARKIILEKAK
jgi:hypothetical protein